MGAEHRPDEGSRRARELAAVDRCLHAVPAAWAEPEQVGAFSLFRPGGARAHLARLRPDADDPPAADLDRLAARCADLGLPVAVEWLASRAPRLGDRCRERGLRVRERDLLVLGPDDALTGPAPRTGVTVVPAGSDLLRAALATTSVGFGTSAEHTGEGDVADRRTLELLVDDGRVAAVADEITRGTTVVTVAVEDDEVVGAALCHRAGTCAEVAAVSVLPARRRRGWADALTRRVVLHAREHGAELVVLSPQDGPSARLFARSGFRPLDRILEVTL